MIEKNNYKYAFLYLISIPKKWALLDYILLETVIIVMTIIKS